MSRPHGSVIVSPVRERMRGIVAMVGAASLWGLSGLLIGRLGTNGVAAAAIVSLAAGVVLLGLGRARGESPLSVPGALGWWLPVLAALEAANASLYYIALHLAPIGIVMSVHLCSPVLLLLFRIGRRQRAIGVREVATLASLVAALVTIGFAQPASATYPHPLLGALLALASAAALAVFITVVGHVAGQVQRLSSAGAQMCCSGLLLLPALILLPPLRADVLPLVLIGVVVFAPAVFLYWEGVIRVGPVLAAAIGLLEPVAATLVGFVLTGAVPGFIQVLAALLAICSAGLEGSRRPEVDERGGSTQSRMGHPK